MMLALGEMEAVVDEPDSIMKTHLTPNFSMIKPPTTGPRAGPGSIVRFRIQLVGVCRI